MNLSIDSSIAEQYKSASQQMRVVTENWVAINMFCPICGNAMIKQYGANKPVADFYCDKCNSDFELKSKQGKFGRLVNDGAFHTMIERIESINNPNFFFMSHHNGVVNDFIFVPNFIFTPSIIEKRKPLSANARRAGWEGCSINISQIPEPGKIYIVKDSKVQDKDVILSRYKQSYKLKSDNIHERTWIFDILNCIQGLSREFTLKEVYEFEPILRGKYPNNNFIKDKIRQQLQLLRDKGLIEFTQRGIYTKIFK